MTKNNCCKYFTVSLVPVASLTLAILFGLGIVALPILYVHLTNQWRYGIVIDAGSSHTDMYFYKWKVPRYRDTGDIKEINHCPSSKSLNSYANSNPNNSGELLKHCIDKSNERHYIPESEQGTTHLYLGATAGMRLVNRSNHTISEQIFSSVNASLKKSPYNFSSGRIITGQEEAVAGWIAGNFLSHALEKSASSLTGSLDLGGASTEIAFQHTSSEHPEYLTTVTLFERDYSLYARSYLCYGLNEANWRLLAHLVNSTENGTGEVENPCLLNGTRLTYNDSEICSSACVTSDTSSEVFGYGYDCPFPSSEAENHTFIGTGEPDKCNKTIHKLFDLTQCSDPTVCINNTYFWPPVNKSGHYLGMSGFFTVAHFFNNSDVKLDDLTNLTETVWNFCRKSNSSASSTYPDNQHLYQLCFDGVYALFLLKTGFGFNSSNSNWTLTFKHKVDKKTVAWSMGYMLNQTTLIPDNPHQVERPFRPVDLVVGIIILSILCVVFVVFFLLTYHACRKVLKSRGGYEHIS